MVERDENGQERFLRDFESKLIQECLQKISTTYCQSGQFKWHILSNNRK